MVTRLSLVRSPLTGPETRDLVAADLAGRGYQVDVPDLTARDDETLAGLILHLIECMACSCISSRVAGIHVGVRRFDGE
jgi:hypothetical protein